MLFKDISYLELWLPLCSVERNHCAILVEGMIRNNSVKLFLIWTSGPNQWFRRCPLQDFLSRTLAALMLGGAKPIMQFQ